MISETMPTYNKIFAHCLMDNFLEKIYNPAIKTKEIRTKTKCLVPKREVSLIYFLRIILD